MARVPTIDVNIEVMMPSINVIAKPLIGPVPTPKSTTAAMSVVTLASTIEENAFSYPAWIAACGEVPPATSSRMR